MSILATLRRSILSRLGRSGRRCALVAVLAALPIPLAGAAVPGWQEAAPLPVPRSEVAAAVLRGEIVVVGGFEASGANSNRVDAYSPDSDRWRSLPRLPVTVDHAMAAAHRGRLYVIGGYGPGRVRLRSTFVLENGRWRRLRPMPQERAAAGAAVVGSTLYVAGGVTTQGLAQRAFAFDLVRRRWRTIPGPTPREHLAVTALRGRVYALAGRRAGFDTNLGALESYAPGARSWRRHAPVPDPRGGTGAAALGRQLVSVGGEGPEGTMAQVWSFDVRTGRWRRLADLPTPRHGLGVVTALGRVYAIAGGRQPGLTVSGTNEFLPVG